MRKLYLIGNIDIGGGAELQMQLIRMRYRERATIITLKDKGLFYFIFLLLFIAPGHLISFHRRTDILACLFGFRHNLIIRESNSAYAKDKGFFEQARILLVRLTKPKVISNNISGKEYWEKFLGAGVCIMPNLFENPKNIEPIEREGTLIVGRLEPHKSVEKSILFAERLEQNIKVVGSGSMLENLIFMSQNIADRDISFLGHIDQHSVYSLMQKSLNLVHLSEYEGYPNVVIQAKLRGMQVFALKTKSNLINISEIVDFWVNDIFEIEKNYNYCFDAEKYLKQNNDNFTKAFDSLTL